MSETQITRRNFLSKVSLAALATAAFTPTALGMTIPLVIPPPLITATMQEFGAVAGGVIDTTAAVVRALSSGMVIDGQGKSYGVSGSIRLDNIGSAFKGLINATIVQLSPSTASCRTFYHSGGSDFIFDNVRIDLGGNFVDGDFNDNAGFYLSACSKFSINNCQVFNGGFVTAYFLAGCTDASITNNIARDLTYNRPLNDPIDDCIQGFFIFGCLRTPVVGNKAHNLTGFLLGVASPRFTRGFSFGGDNSDFGVVGNTSSLVDQGYDFTGNLGTSQVAVSGNAAVDCGTVGFKFANAQRKIAVGANVATRCGQWAFIVSGLSSSVSAGYNPKDFIIAGCMAIDTGAPSPVTGTIIWPGLGVGFMVLLSGAGVDNNTPNNVQFYNCQAIDRQTVPTMMYGYRNQVAPAGTLGVLTAGCGYNTIVNCTSIGHVTAAQLGFVYFVASVSSSVNQSIANATPTGLAWNTDVENSSVTMHSTVTSNPSIYAPFTGWYEIEGLVEFAANATGSRTVDVWLNGATKGFVFNRTAAASGVTDVPFFALYKMNAGEAVRIVVTQDSTAALNVSLTNTRFVMRLVVNEG